MKSRITLITTIVSIISITAFMGCESGNTKKQVFILDVISHPGLPFYAQVVQSALNSFTVTELNKGMQAFQDWKENQRDHNHHANLEGFGVK